MPKASADLRSLARQQTKMGVRVLSHIAMDPEEPGSARVAAVGLLFERGWGKAPQTHTDVDGIGPIQVIIRHIVENTIENEPVLIEHEPDRDR